MNLSDDQMFKLIDEWNNGAGVGKSLYEYMGISWEQYKNWVEGVDDNP